MASEASVTYIGRSVFLRGELSGEGDVQIDGSLEGSVQLAGARITVGPEAQVRALLSAQDIIVHGRVEGELRATGRVDVRSTAFVLGDIYTARLSVEDEATLQGHMDSLQGLVKNGTENGSARAPQEVQPGTSKTQAPVTAESQDTGDEIKADGVTK